MHRPAVRLQRKARGSQECELVFCLDLCASLFTYACVVGKGRACVRVPSIGGCFTSQDVMAASCTALSCPCTLCRHAHKRLRLRRDHIDTKSIGGKTTNKQNQKNMKIHNENK